MHADGPPHSAAPSRSPQTTTGASSSLSSTTPTHLRLPDLPAATVSSILVFLPAREKLRQAVRPSHSLITPLFTAASFAHDQLSLRVSKVSGDWPQRPTVPRLVSGVASVWLEDDAAYRLPPNTRWDEDEEDCGRQKQQGGQREDDDGLNSRSLSDAELLDQQRGALTQSTRAEAPRTTRYYQILTRKYARCLSVSTALTCLRLAIPPHQLGEGRTDDALLSTIFNAADAFSFLNTLLLHHQDGRKPVYNAIGSLILRPLQRLPALTALRLDSELTLRDDCLQLLCELPHLMSFTMRHLTDCVASFVCVSYELGAASEHSTDDDSRR